jgi:hypothetical protein
VPSQIPSGVDAASPPITPGIERKSAFLELSRQNLQAALQRAARAAMGALLQLISEPPDHQITTEAQRRITTHRTKALGTATAFARYDIDQICREPLHVEPEVFEVPAVV